MDLVALSNGLHGSVQMDSVALFSWIGWLRHYGILNESIHLPFIDTLGLCYYATQHRIIKCSKKLFGFKFKEWKWNQIKSINYLKRVYRNFDTEYSSW